MAEFFRSGQVVYWIIGMMVLEFLALVVLYKRTRRTLPWFELLCNMAAGAALLLALRAALTYAAWITIAGCLSAALAAHVFNMYSRWVAQR